jgi:TolB-like protein/DNA-binding winged helix-turn-helix (wHTH) protein
MPRDVLRIGNDLELDRTAYELRRSGRPLKLERIPMEILLLLIDRRGQLVSREDIIEKIWGKDVYLDTDNSINSAIRKIRQVLKDDPEKPSFIQTVTAKGYRFIAAVTEIEDPAPSPSAPAISAPVVSAPGVSPEPEIPLSPIPSADPSPGPPQPPTPHPPRSRWVVVPVVALLVLLAAGIYLLRLRARTRPAASASHRVMLAVLPFVNLSGDPTQDYFVDGLTEEMITQLGGMSPPTLGVIARTSSMQFKNSGKSVSQIARELGVAYVMEGSVRRSGDHLRITAQLISANDQTHLWARDYDRKVSDVLEIQTAISIAVAQEVRAALPDAAANATGGLPMDEAAHDAYLRGLHGLNQRTKPGLTSAISEFRQAVSIDPNSAAAWAALARTYSLAPVFTILSSAEALPLAREAATRALSLDDNSPDAHCTLAFVLAHYDFAWPGAEREYKRALELNPSDANSHFFYSNSFLSPLGRHDEAVAEMRTAISLDPLSFPIQSFVGRTLFWAHRYDEASAQFVKANAMNPNSAIGHERMAHLYAAWEKYPEAISEEENARILSGESPETAVAKAEQIRTAFKQRGPRGYWEQELILAAASQNPPEFYTGPFGRALLYAQLARVKEANAALEQAFSEHDLRLTEIGIEPLLEPIRANDQFRRLESKVTYAAPKTDFMK